MLSTAETGDDEEEEVEAIAFGRERLSRLPEIFGGAPLERRLRLTEVADADDEGADEVSRDEGCAPPRRGLNPAIGEASEKLSL